MKINSFYRFSILMACLCLSFQNINGQPEIKVKGNGIEITNGQIETSILDFTDFAVRNVGLTYSNTFKIFNTGTSNLIISLPLVIGGKHSADFIITSDPATVISAGDSTSFTVEFSPSANGQRDADITITNDDNNNNPFQFTLMGFGDGAALACRDCFGIPRDNPFVCSGGSKGDCIYGTCYCDGLVVGSNCQIPVRWSDGQIIARGTYDFFPKIYVGPRFADPNEIYFLSVKVNATDIFPGSKGITYGVISTPQTDYAHDIGAANEWGYHSLTGEIIHNNAVIATGDPYGVGDVLGMIYDAPAKSLEFLLKKVESTNFVSQAIIYDVENVPGKTLALALSNTCFGVCAYEFVVDLKDELEVKPADANPGIITVKGNGNNINDGSSTISSDNNTFFGSISLGDSTFRSFTIHNFGSDGLDIDLPLSISGENPADFKIVTQPDSLVASGDSTSFLVKFKPIDLGNKTADMIISNDDCDHSIFNFSIMGQTNDGSSSPIAGNNTLLINSNIYTITVSDFLYFDPDNDPLNHVEIVSIPTNGTLFLDNNNNGSVDIGEVVSNNDQIMNVDLEANKFKYQSTLNDDSFDFRVHDGTQYSSSTYTMTLEVISTPSGNGTSNDPYLISSIANLYWISQNSSSWDKYFMQINDIDLDVSPLNTGSGWQPIGTEANRFLGSYDGNGYKISNLFINRSSTDNVGLFGANDGTIKNLALVNVNIAGAQFSGAIAGRNFENISNCYSTGSVTGTIYVGGITGHSMNDAGTGLVEKCYSSASVSGNEHVGGLVGRLFNGLVGTTITQSYSVGVVIGSSDAGGLLGSNSGGTASLNFWNTQTSGQVGSAAGTGKTTDEMRGITASNSITDWGWDTSIWERIGHNYPTLKVMHEVNLDNIGNSDFSVSDFRDIGLKAETGTTSVDFEFFASTTPPDIPDGSRSIEKYWDIMSLSGNTKIRLYYTADEKSQFTGTPKIYHYTGGAWVELPTEPEVDIDDLGTNFYVETTNYYSSFSPVTVGDDAAPLPVELISFEGYNTEEGVVLNWDTTTEVNNYGFEVQKSEVSSQNSEVNWINVGFVEGHGTTNSPKHYEFTDSELPNSESVDYRLKQIDNDGVFAYSKTITVDLTTITSVEDEEIPTVYSLEQNYPNPFNPVTTIKFGLPEDGFVDLRVYNILGQEVARLVNKEMRAGYHEVSFGNNNLSSGMYIYRISVGDKFNSVKKMLMVK